MFGFEIIKQAMDHKHDAALSEAFEAAIAESSGILLRCLPRLYESYVQNVKRHKSSLFSQGSNQAPGQINDQVQRASMTFYAACDALARTITNDASWECHVSLLEVVEKDNLLNMQDEEAKALLRKDADLAVEGLVNAWDGSYLPLPVLVEYCLNLSLLERLAGRTENAVKILATLTRIDYGLVSASFAVVFPRLLAVSLVPWVTLHGFHLRIFLDSRGSPIGTTVSRNPPRVRLENEESAVYHRPHLRGVFGSLSKTYFQRSAGSISSHVGRSADQSTFLGRTLKVGAQLRYPGPSARDHRRRLTTPARGVPALRRVWSEACSRPRRRPEEETQEGRAVTVGGPVGDRVPRHILRACREGHGCRTSVITAAYRNRGGAVGG